MDSQRIPSPSLGQIKLPDQKPAQYAGIKSGKDTKILDSHGKLVTHFGRNIENFFDIELFHPEKHQLNKARHEYQKDLTERRVKLLTTQKVEKTSDHINSILNLPESIEKNCDFVNREKFTKLVQSDVKKYLSYEIRSCNSAARLVELHQEVERLREKKLPPKITHSLSEEINNQMAILIKEMPKHLRSIDHDITQPQTLALTKQKCKVVEDLLESAKTLHLYDKHRKTLSNMMIDMFSEDVAKVTSLCLERNNLKENKDLSDEIETARDLIVHPFIKSTCTDVEKHFKKVKRSTDIQIKDLKAQREIIPNIVKKINNTLTRASTIITREADRYSKKKQIQPTKKTTKRIEENEKIKFSDFQKAQEEYKISYAKLNYRLKQFKSSVEIYFKDQQNPDQDQTDLKPESLTHPEAFLTAYRGVTLTESWENLQNLDPAETNSNLALESFNHACFDSHFKKLESEEQVWLTKEEIDTLKNSVQESVTGSSDQKEAYDKLVVAHTACLLAKKAHRDAIKPKRPAHKKTTSTRPLEYLETAKQLRMFYAQSLASNKTDDVNAQPGVEMDESNNHSLSSSDVDQRHEAPAASLTEVHQESVFEKPLTLKAQEVLPPIGSNSTGISTSSNQSKRSKRLPPIERPTRRPPPIPTSNKKSAEVTDQTDGRKAVPTPPPRPPLPSSYNTKSAEATDQTDGRKAVPTPPPPPPLPSFNNTKSAEVKEQTDGRKAVPTPPPPPPLPSGNFTKSGRATEPTDISKPAPQPPQTDGSHSMQADIGVEGPELAKTRQRKNLLDEIKQGITLKKPKDNKPQKSKGSIFDSAKELIIERGKMLNGDGDSDGDNDND
ncbi:hypothetical protein [Endozoicomonas sp. ONNA2]|uniref:hypothetical protein n=1 Tax=Endozoicomonas sp. ONNA2 TaxID=2828741 RepID=UPI002147B868|nr:hypothetical protein [Endozoicomonas sp. ONNA2]